MAGIAIQIGERRFDVAPYMLDELIDAAPFIDEMTGKKAEIDAVIKQIAAGEVPPFAIVADYARILCEIVAVGISRVDPAFDVKAIRRGLGVNSIGILQAAVNELLQSSGMAPRGEAKAPSPRKRKGAKA